MFNAKELEEIHFSVMEEDNNVDMTDEEVEVDDMGAFVEQEDVVFNDIIEVEEEEDGQDHDRDHYSGRIDP